MSRPSDFPQTFTVAQANALLAKIIPLIEQLQSLQRSILQTNLELNEATGKIAEGNGYPLQSIKKTIKRLLNHQLRLIDAFHSALKQLEDIGGILKDLHMGLVDFYGMRKGELVFLCWKLGEDRIRFWHSLDTGYAGRQPLDVEFF